MMRYVIFSMFLLVSVSCMAENENLTAFKAACDLFKEAIELNVDKQAMSDYISENLPKRVKSDEVIATYSAIFNADPSERLGIFEASVKHYTQSNWTCNSAKKLFSKE